MVSKNSRDRIVKIEGGSITDDGINIEFGLGDIVSLELNIGDDVEVPDHLEPIEGSDFLQTPNEPVDPTDCERWPDSPFCGGGWDPTTPLGIEIEVSISKCEKCITYTPTVLGFTMAPYTFCQRDPSCIEEPIEPTAPSPDHPIPPELPLLPDIDDDAIVLIANEGRNYYYSYAPSSEVYREFIHYEISNIQITACWVPGITTYTHFTNDYEPTEGFFELVVTRNHTGYFNDGFGNSDTEPRNTKDEQTTAGITLGLTGRTSTPEICRQIILSGYSGHLLTGALYGRWGTLKAKYYQDHQRLILRTQNEFTTSYSLTWPVLLHNFDKRKEDIPVYYPPQPQLKEMDCCAESLELLRLLHAKIGTKKLPAVVPEYLLADKNKPIKIESITEFMGWFVKQIDALGGQWPIEIEIEDADPTQKGNQTKPVKLDNMAEAVAELYGLTVKAATDGDIATNFLMRLAAEMVATKNATLITQDYARANASALGYKGNPKRREVQYSFDPTRLDSLENILAEKTGFVVGWQNDQKETAFEYFQRFMYIASLWKEKNFKSKNRVAEIANSLKEMAGQGLADDELWNFFVEALNAPTSVFHTATDANPKIEEIKPQ